MDKTTGSSSAMRSLSMRPSDSPPVSFRTMAWMSAAMRPASARAWNLASAFAGAEVALCAVISWSRPTSVPILASLSLTCCVSRPSWTCVMSRFDTRSTIADILSTRSRMPPLTVGQCSATALASSVTRVSTAARAACTSLLFSGRQRFTDSRVCSPSSLAVLALVRTNLLSALLTGGHLSAAAATSSPVPACTVASAACTSSLLYRSVAMSTSSAPSSPTV
mmetsp:Transcript_14370/g.40943  ORF Transcript_14370/g.40943 Transcript_14370/m.40943 type:complete len:222 (+) Transcript_14370:103-768(+)